LEEKFDKYFFGDGLIYVEIFWGIQNNLKIHGSEMFKALKSDMGFLGG